MKFSNDGNSSQKRSGPKYSQAYIEERRKELDELLAKAKTEQDKEMLIKAFEVSINP